jgi:formylglycine-generating enzyme required for sulfatase activity/N-acetylneuraminic acid mutarotase
MCFAFWEEEMGRMIRQLFNIKLGMVLLFLTCILVVQPDKAASALKPSTPVLMSNLSKPNEQVEIAQRKIQSFNRLSEIPVAPQRNILSVNYFWTLRANMPTPRQWVGLAAATNGKIYAIGGYDGSVLNLVEEYDPASDTWTGRANMPTSRSAFGAATAPNGKIYAIGGWNNSYLSTVEEYDPVNNTWATRASMPTARYGLAVATGSNGKIYAVGGVDVDGNNIATVEEYDPVNDTWISRASLATSRRDPGIAATNYGKIYVMGGSRVGYDGDVLDENEEYDIATNTWTTRASMPTKRTCLGAAVGPDGKVYAIGGATSNVEAYNPSNNSWETIASMSTVRNCHGVARAQNGRIYAVGGWGSSGYQVSNEELTIEVPVAYSVSGKVTTSGGVGISGISILTSGEMTSSTDIHGDYILTNLITGTYTITPTKGGYTFTPSSQQVTVGPDQTSVNFTGVSLPPSSGEMVSVPAGNFQMGCSPNDTTCDPNESPLHTVYLSAYEIDKYEVTNARYATCVNAGGCSAPKQSNSDSRSSYYGNSTYDDYPVLYVNWDQADIFCQWENKHLPTEAEWEKAARGSTNISTFPWGDQLPNCTLGNFVYNNRCVGDTSQVGSFPDGASPYGALDIAGNVWEWVSDYYQADYYSSKPTWSNPTGPASGTNKLLRGGAWLNVWEYSRVSYRYEHDPNYWGYDVGFRCARAGSSPSTFTISGKVTIDGTTSLAGVTVSDNAGHIAVTNASGSYTLSELLAGSYTLTPSMDGYNFIPAALSVIVGPDAAGKNFTAVSTDTTLLLQADSGYESIHLTWNAAADPTVNAYRLWRATPDAASPFSILATISETYYSDSQGLIQQHGYCYKVEAISGQTAVDISNIDCAVFGQVNLWIPDTYALAGSTVIVPVNIRNADGLGIASADIWIDFDPTVLECQAVSKTPMTVDFLWEANRDNVNGRVRISTLSYPPKVVYGDGSLFWLTFLVKGSNGATSKLDLKEYVNLVGGSSIQTLDTNQNPVDVPLSLTDGTLFIQTTGMLGDVDNSGVVAAADALLALQMATGARQPTQEQRYTADVNGDGAITSADVTMILYYAAYGSWPLPTSSTLRTRLDAGSITSLSLGEAEILSGEEVSITLSARGLMNWAGGDFVITYDKDQVAQVVKVEAAGLAASSPLAFYDDGNGSLHFSIARNSMVSGDGALATIRLHLASNVLHGNILLSLADARLNDRYGRDFVHSVLQGKIERQGTVIHLRNAVYLPFIQQ